VRPVRSARRRALALIAAAAICAGLAVPAPQPTEATWVDSEAGSATFTAITVSAPTYVSCQASGLLGGLLGLAPTLDIVWNAPSHAGDLVLEIASVDASGLVIELLNPLLGTVTTQPVAGVSGQYKTTVNTGLLSGLLGGEARIALRYKSSDLPGAWVSPWLTVRGTWPALGILGSPSCGRLP